MTSRILTGALIVAALGSSACSSAPTRVFALTPVLPQAPVAAGPTAGYAGPALRVDVVYMPPWLDRAELVASAGAGRFEILDLDRWSAPLGQLARQTLSADLAARLPPGRLIFPHLSKPQGALGISVDILDFGIAPEGARLQASWTLRADAGSDRGGGPMVLRTTGVGAAGGARDAAALAGALSELLGELADRIVASLPPTGGG